VAEISGRGTAQMISNSRSVSCDNRRLFASVTRPSPSSGKRLHNGIEKHIVTSNPASDGLRPVVGSLVCSGRIERGSPLADART
jgi:hypothetical protein